MNKYITSLIIVSIVGGIISNMLSSFGGIKKYVNYFIGIVAITCLLSPIFSVVNNISLAKANIKEYFNDLINQDAINESNEIIVNSGIESIQNGIKNTIIDKYGFDERDVIVSLEADTSKIEAIKIKHISVILTGKASWSDVDEVKRYLENIIGGSISVTRK